MVVRRMSNMLGVSGVSRVLSKVFNCCSFMGVFVWCVLEGYDGFVGVCLSNIVSMGGVIIVVSSDIVMMMV